jgi:hypothetical protein
MAKESVLGSMPPDVAVGRKAVATHPGPFNSIVFILEPLTD